MTFLYILIYIVFQLIHKFVFVVIEPKYLSSWLGVVEAGFLGLFVLTGVMLSIKRQRKTNDKQNEKIKLTEVLLIGAIIMVVLFSSALNKSKKVMEWDAVALYDARAMFLKAGVKFSDMVQFSKYDEVNYYYLMYPPFTSISHYMWREVLPTVSVSLYYSVYLLLFAVGLYLLASKLLGRFYGLLAVLLTILIKDIFILSILEYANLPFTTNIVFAVLLLAIYLKYKEKWTLFMSAVLLALSQWIRFLEPVWLLVITVFSVVLIKEKRYKELIISVLILLTPSVLNYLSWNNFVSNIAHNPNSVTTNTSIIINMIIGLVAGKAFEVFKYCIKVFGLQFVGYLATLISGLLFIKRKIMDSSFTYLLYFLTATILFYFIAIYYSSFQGEWWQSLGGSVIRSSSYIIPIAIIINLGIIKQIMRGNAR